MNNKIKSVIDNKNNYRADDNIASPPLEPGKLLINFFKGLNSYLFSRGSTGVQEGSGTGGQRNILQRK